MHEVRGSRCTQSAHVNDRTILHLPYLGSAHFLHGTADAVFSILFRGLTSQSVDGLKQLDLLRSSHPIPTNMCVTTPSKQSPTLQPQHTSALITTREHSAKGDRFQSIMFRAQP